MSQALFTPDGSQFIATDLTRGPWDPNAQHGGAPAALLARAFERIPGSEELVLARITYEFLRPVPLGALAVNAEIVRPGRRVRLLEGSIVAADGNEVVRARALQVLPADRLAANGLSTMLPPGPEHGQENDLRPRYRPMFAPDAVEVRFVSGTFHGSGPASAWFRLRHPVVAGEHPSSLQRLAAAADFGNGISSTISWDEYLFINPDLTLYAERDPVGEWICVEAETRIARGGVGVSESVLYDERGRVGRAIQALLVARR